VQLTTKLQHNTPAATANSISGVDRNAERASFITEVNVDNHPSYRLYEEALRIKGRNPEQAIIMLEKALVFATNMNSANPLSSEHKLNVYAELIRLCISVKKYSQAADLMEGQLELVRQATSDRTVEVNILHQLGRLHFVMKNFAEAETCHALQQNLAHQIYDHKGEMQAFYGQGMSLHAQGMNEDAALMYKKYLDNAEANIDTKEVAIAHGRLGNVFRDMKEYDQSFASFKNQISVLRDLLNDTAGDTSILASLASAFGNLGMTYQLWGKLPLACNAYKKEIKLSRDLGMRELQAATTYKLGVTTIEMHLGINLKQLPNYFPSIPGGEGGIRSDSLFKDKREIWKLSGLLRYVMILREVLINKERDNFGSRGDGNILNSKKLENMLKSLNDGLDHFLGVLTLCEDEDNVRDGIVSEETHVNSLIYCGVLTVLKDGKYYHGNKHFQKCEQVLAFLRDKNEAIGKRNARTGDRTGQDFEKNRRLISSSEKLLCIMRNVLLLLLGEHEICLHNLQVMLDDEQRERFVDIKRDSPMLILIKSMLSACFLRTNDTKNAITNLESLMQLCEIERFGAGNAFGLLELGEIKSEQYREKLFTEDLEYARELFSALIDWAESVSNYEISSVAMDRLGDLIDFHLSNGEINSDAEFNELEQAVKNLRANSMAMRGRIGDMNGATEIQANLLLSAITANVEGRGAGVSAFMDR